MSPTASETHPVADAAVVGAVTAIAAQRAKRQARLVLLALAMVRRAWDRKDWNGLASLLTILQHEIADSVTAVVAETMAAQGVQVQPVAAIVPTKMVGYTASGWPLADYLAGAEKYQQLVQAVLTEMADAERVSSQVAAVAIPVIDGYVRYLTPPSCARCTILAGRFYRWSKPDPTRVYRWGDGSSPTTKPDGFPRHPNCLPAGATVSGPGVEAASRRWYEGELVTLETASGQQLTITGNHPVLTDQGWMPANLVTVGDHVVRSLSGQGATPLVVPDEQQAPALIEDVWGAHNVVPFGKVPTAAEDFHGDGGHGDVDVVLADRLLRDRAEVGVQQRVVDEPLTRRAAKSFAFAGLGGCHQAFVGPVTPTQSLMGSGGLGLALLGCHPPSPGPAGLLPAADLDVLLQQSTPNHLAGDLVTLTQAQLGLAGEVGVHDVLHRHADPVLPARWDAPAGPMTPQSVGGYAGRGLDLLQRLASQVELDRVVDVRRVQWSGHVYNLTSAEGWYSVDTIVVSNCDCVMVYCTDDPPAGLIGDPMEAFTLGQVTGLSKADTAAIEHGADLAQVVNVRRKEAGLTVAGRVLDRGGRLTPEAIMQFAEDRDDIIALLTKAGYLTPLR